MPIVWEREIMLPSPKGKNMNRIAPRKVRVSEETAGMRKCFGELMEMKP
jgi:hypothetical protein